LPQQPDGHAAQPAPGALSEDQRNAARANTVDDLYMEQIAHTIAYQGAGQGQTAAQLFGPVGARTAMGAAFEKKGFDIDNIRCVVGAGSLKLWSLPARADSKVTPVVAFCGTQDAKDVSDDANPEGVGMGQFTRNQALIQAELQRIGAGKGVTATGHSLGGTLAQIAACFFSNLIVNVVTFSAPGISKDVLARLKEKGAGDVTAHHFRVADDLVDDAGEAFIPGQTQLVGKTGQLNPVDAHNSYAVLSKADHDHDPEVAKWMQDAAGTRDVPKLGDKTQTDSNPDHLGRSLSGVIEPIRKKASGIGSWASGVIGGAIGFLGGGTAGAKAGSAQAKNKIGTPEMQLDQAYTKIWLALLPQLDASLSIGPTGEDPKFGTALKNMVEFKQFNVQGGLTFSRGLEQRDIRGKQRELDETRQKLAVQAVDLRAGIAQTMTRAVAQLELARRRIALAQTAIDLANQNIKIETDRFNLGKSTNFDVLNRLEDLRQAQLRKAQAMVDWHKAEVVVQALTGDLLPMYGISVDS